MTPENPSADPTMWDTVLHSGLAGSFLRFPYVPPDSLVEGKAGAAIYGMPWDSMQVSRTGANYGPRGIRDISCQSLTYNATWDFDLLEELSPVDCGDCRVVIGNPERTFERAQGELERIIASGAIPVVLGGDHSVTIPAVRAVQASDPGDVGLVLIDTHLDTALDVGGEELSNCCPITRAIDAGFDPEATVLVGISGWMNPRTEIEYCVERGITVIWLEDIWQLGTSRVSDAVREIAGRPDGLYLTIDIDGLDAAFAPGTSAPTPGGLSARETIELVRGISAAGLVGLDVVETAPSLDATSATAGMAVRLVLDALAAHCGAFDSETRRVGSAVGR